MTILRFLLATALLVAAAPTALASGTGLPAPTCFTKTQKCCYNFKPCDKIVKKTEKKVPCPFKKYNKVCVPKCTIKESKTPEKKCIDKKVVVGKTCKKIKIKKGHIWIWKLVCTPKFAIKKICNTIIIIKKNKDCKLSCKDVSKIVPAVCIKIEVREFIKFCPKLSCGPLVGSGTSPASFVSKTGKLVKTLDGKRIVPKHSLRSNHYQGSMK